MIITFDAIQYLVIGEEEVVDLFGNIYDWTEIISSIEL